VAARGLHSPAAHKKFTIGIVLDVGGVNDKSFNHLAYVGLQKAEAKYSYVKGTYISTQEQSQYVPNITHYAGKVNLVIATGALMSQAIYQVARQYPHQHFAIIDGAPADANFVTHNLPNVENLLFHEQESGFLAGIVAGLMEKNHVGKAKHNVIGYMGGLPVPAVIRYEAGYIAGARKVDPSIRVCGSYSQSFTDQTKGNAIGRTQISKGADILFAVAGASGLGYLAAAQQEGRYGIGVDADQGYLGKYVITSAIKRVDKAVLQAVTATLHGKFRGGNHFYTIHNGGTGIGRISPIVPKYIGRIAKIYEKKMKAGKIHPATKIPSNTGC
ncbi:MAG: BMP family lipoprotein, partial [Chloroflexota bacterium]